MAQNSTTIDPAAKGHSQQFLDENQYSMRGVLRYERIFGHTWLSTGGAATTQEFAEWLGLSRGQRVLDIGCGTGGSAFYFAKHFGAEVVGVDLSTHMLDLAHKRWWDMPETVRSKVQFIFGDALKLQLPAASFDVIYSRDTVLHVRAKEELYARLRGFLKPGGKLLVTDYCRGDQAHSPAFQDYVRSRGYDLRTVAQYGQVLEGAGYKNVVAKDVSDKFLETLQRELRDFKANRQDFLKDFSEEDYQYIVEGWEAKMARCSAGDQAWALLHASN